MILKKKMDTVKISLLVRIYNEEYFLEDFIDYYYNLGVDEILFFDSNSTDSSLKILKKLQKTNE